MKTTVINKYHTPPMMEHINIMRGTKWGNPHVMKGNSAAERERVVAEYRKTLWSKIKDGQITVQDLQALNGKTLVCCCKPKACHGDVIVAAVDWAMKQEATPCI